MPPSRQAPAAAPARRGFTLVELMLAVAVVAVLATLSAAAWSGWRERANVARAQEDILTLSVVIDQHFTDTGSLPASLAAIGRGAMVDPWGRAYDYLPLVGPASRGHARKDHSLVPLNTDYDLYSRGPDGATAPPLTARASRDDIVRANNGRFVGRASSY